MSRTCLALAWLCVPLLLAGGCQRFNPAFDPDAGNEGSGTEDGGSTSESSTTQTSSSESSGDGDGDPTTGEESTGDGDGEPATSEGPVDTGMEAPIEVDLPGECVVETHGPLSPRYGAPAQFDGGMCPGNWEGFIKVVGKGVGVWKVQRCSPGCESCDDGEPLLVGAQPLALELLMPPPALNPNVSSIGCHYMEAAELVVAEDSACHYSAIGVHGAEGPGTPLDFLATRDSWGLSPSASDLYSDWKPDVIEQLDMDQCACADLDIDCCADQTVIAKKFELGPNMWVYPGGEGTLYLGNDAAYTFFGVQAQSGTNCEIDPETSWALLRQQ